jgi:hypothetical protein
MDQRPVPPPHEPARPSTCQSIDNTASTCFGFKPIFARSSGSPVQHLAKPGVCWPRRIACWAGRSRASSLRFRVARLPRRCHAPHIRVASYFDNIHAGQYSRRMTRRFAIAPAEAITSAPPVRDGRPGKGHDVSARVGKGAPRRSVTPAGVREPPAIWVGRGWTAGY